MYNSKKSDQEEQKVTVGVYTEGSADSKIIQDIVEIEQFKHHTQKCVTFHGNGRGGSPKDILQGCIEWNRNKSYNAIFCVIDLDKCYHDFPSKASKYIRELELVARSSNVEIIWQENNLEDELRKSLDLDKSISKSKVFKLARKDPILLLNTSYYRKVLQVFQEALGILKK